MTDLESFRALISQRQHEAEEAFVRGDVRPRLQMWSHNDPVSLFAAVGPSKTGWNELDPAFHAVASRLVGGHDVSYEIMACDVTDEMAWTAGFVHFTVSIDGGPLTRYTLRITHVYRREAGEWKVVHEHSNSSQPPDPPRQLPNCQGTVIERTRVARHDWLHGLAPCPKCGLPLDRHRDPNEDTAEGLAVTHLRCGARFFLELEP